MSCSALNVSRRLRRMLKSTALQRNDEAQSANVAAARFDLADYRLCKPSSEEPSATNTMRNMCCRQHSTYKVSADGCQISKFYL
jgi:hypothetical protein